MKADYSRIPPATLQKLQKWITLGVQLDDDDDSIGFVMAVLMNDLAGAVARADPADLAALPMTVRWLECHAPPLAWGSAAALGAWPRLARRQAGSRI
jgi:hypothetical protein